jgi:polygalacturonase
MPSIPAAKPPPLLDRRRAAAAAVLLAAATLLAFTATAPPARANRAAAVPIATGDPRTVRQPHLPPTCAVVTARESAHQRTFSDADEAAPPDTARIQAALNDCAGSGGAVVLAGSGPYRAFLSGPLSIGSDVTLVVRSGVTLFASRNPASYQIAGKSQCGTITAAGDGCSPFITIASHSAHNAVTRLARRAQLRYVRASSRRRACAPAIAGRCGSHCLRTLATDV